MSKDLAILLDECLERIRAGATVEECLASSPDEAEDLAPLLETLMMVRELRTVEPPPPLRMAAGRQRLLARAAELRQQEARAQAPSLGEQLSRLGQALASWLPSRPTATRWAFTAIATLLFLVVVGSSVVRAAGASLPGDPLYPVKRTTQAVRLALVLDETARAELERQIQAQRRAEALAVARQRRRVTVDFSGEIKSLREGTWVVSGVPVVVDEQTEVQGPVEPGLPARIVAVSQGDGTLRAQRIVVSTPTPTPTPTSTSFASTQVVTPTATATPTRLPPTSIISVATARPTSTATSAPPQRVTPTFTPTWMPTPTATPTARPPTMTPTPRPATPRPVETPRPPTSTPTTRPPTATSTPRPPTPVLTPTDTPTVPTVTVGPSFTPTEVSTGAATALITPGFTATWVPTQAITPTARPRFTATWEPNGYGHLRAETGHRIHGGPTAHGHDRGATIRGQVVIENFAETMVASWSREGTGEQTIGP